MRDLIAAGPVEPLDMVDVKRLGLEAQSFMDINTPEDLAAAREISSQSRPSTSSG
jgi:molybdopterin-guanine dinucleotide biosynthesis protein A